MQITGIVKEVRATQQVSASFQKRELIVTTDEQYPQHIMIEFAQDKCDLLDSVKVGQQVTVGINLRGREWVNPQGETKYFNSIQGWRIDKGEPAKEAPAKQPAAAFQEEETDDLPF